MDLSATWQRKRMASCRHSPVPPGTLPLWNAGVMRFKRHVKYEELSTESNVLFLLSASS